MLISGSMHIGGAERVVLHLARGLNRSRFDVGLCCTREAGILADALADASIPVILAAPASRRLRYLIPLYLRRIIAEYKPDLVHSHGTPSLLHTGPLGVASLLPPWIHTYHFGNYPDLPKRFMRAERLYSRYPSKLVAVSNAQRDAIIRHHRVPPDRIRTITNGVVANPFVDDVATRTRKRRELGFAADDIVVGCVAVLSEQKGITYLLQAGQALLSSTPRIRLLVAGGGPLEQQLRQEAQSLGLGTRVVFTGWRSDYLELLVALDVFVMSSLWEAMPMALLEAMAARRVIVATDVGDNAHVLRHGNAGILIPSRDPAAIVDALKRVLSDTLLQHSLSDCAQEQFSRHYTLQIMCNSYEALYRLVLDSPDPRHGRKTSIV